MKLNLGAGKTNFEGFINVDKSTLFNPAIVHDLEVTPWPFESDSVDEIKLYHILEHLGENSNKFIEIIQELYRICEHNALIDIVVPNPFSIGYLGDPTHVRPITPELFMLFDKELNLFWQQDSNTAYSLLALEHNVDFKISQVDLIKVRSLDIITSYDNHDSGQAINSDLLNVSHTTYLEYMKGNNLYSALHIIIRVIKC
jgi:hypothetical protein